MHQYGFAQLDGLTIDHPDDNTKGGCVHVHLRSAKPPTLKKKTNKDKPPCLEKYHCYCVYTLFTFQNERTTSLSTRYKMAVSVLYSEVLFYAVASIRVGKIEMVSYTAKDEAAPPTKTFTYSLTKIKSWKLGGKVLLWIRPPPRSHMTFDLLQPGHPWLKFFFQLGAGDFVPVGVVGGQSVLLSYSLHSIVDELLRVRAKQDIRQPATQVWDGMGPALK